MGGSCGGAVTSKPEGWSLIPLTCLSILGQAAEPHLASPVYLEHELYYNISAVYVKMCV